MWSYFLFINFITIIEVSKYRHGRMFCLLFASLLLTCGAQFVDDFQAYEKECLGEDRFTCMDGGCILQKQYCDRVEDCADGSDENFCPEHPPDERHCNETHQFMCHDAHACIPRYWVCNGDPDCGDASDEANCTDPANTTNSKCKGFQCTNDGPCISSLWACDGHYDCPDRSDEDIEGACKRSLKTHTLNDGISCDEFLFTAASRQYKCQDDSFCLSPKMMCDGIKDCRDGSDEGPFCSKWATMCDNSTCPLNITVCTKERTGPECKCLYSAVMRQYNPTTRSCDDVDDCLSERPSCSQKCINADGHFKCACEEGYTTDKFQYLCYSQGPEAMLFYSTQKDIRYLRVKSKQEVVVATGIKQAHGVSYDGKHLYWVETAQGHQAIVRATLDNVAETKQTLVSLGLEDPGDIAVDWRGGHIYFSDSERGTISVCRTDGSVCATVKTNARRPRFVTLDVKNGIMYWADYHDKPVIMRARMDGSKPEVLVSDMRTYASGLAIDVPNDRLYYVDITVRVVKVDTKQVYSLFDERFHHPYAIAVFENSVYWSDWISNTIQLMDKIVPTANRNVVIKLHAPVYDMHMYHPILYGQEHDVNPCAFHNCSHLCLLTSNTTSVCACPDEMVLNGTTCHSNNNYHPLYLIVGGGAYFTRIQYDLLGNPEMHATTFDIGRVQAMAYDSRRDVLYVYDATRRTINWISMSEFSLGVTRLFAYKFENVVDMDYDFVTDSLYILDADRHFLEVINLKSEKRALVHRFTEQETPISLCVLPDYGRLLVAVMENEQNNEIHIDSMGLDGEDRQHLILNNLKGPHVTLRYAHYMDNVYVSDESSGTIDYVHPKGTGRENYRELSTTVTSLAITDNLVFWTDRRTPRLFWADIHDTSPRVRRFELSIFPNDTHLYIQATSIPPDANAPLSVHPCNDHPCSDICVQSSHAPPFESHFLNLPYRCLCPAGLVLEGHNCSKMVVCKWKEFYCHKSNECVEWAKKCDGKKDCSNGEDEEFCVVVSPRKKPATCKPNEVLCNNECIRAHQTCGKGDEDISAPPACDLDQYQCHGSHICVEHSQVCDKTPDCPDGSDEGEAACDTLACFHTEFMCASGSCVLASWRCDGDPDCNDGSDEVDCENQTCSSGFFRCHSGQCIELHKRCDGYPNCLDGSDENRCHDSIDEIEVPVPTCGSGEYGCELNKSICLPLTAWCNSVIDCPGGTDEVGCQFRCAMRGLFDCKDQPFCVSMRKVCNGDKDCSDGSDETPEACAQVNKTSRLFPPLYPAAECRHGYLCRTGQCIEWREVCDSTPNCFDGSDENGKCFTACENNTCSHKCQPTPLGAKCTCHEGYELNSDGRTCDDLDECRTDVCAQRCFNTPGSFLCGCRRGYAPRSDRRSCKATRGSMSLVYASGYSVRSVSSEGYGRVEFEDKEIGHVEDVDVNVAKKSFYITSPETGQLIEVNGSDVNLAISNIGRPTRVAVEWVTGNVYFVDNTPGAIRIRVCNFQKMRCAKLHKLPTDSFVSSLVVSPETRRLHFCIDQGTSSVIWGGDLSGLKGADLAVEYCAGLAADGNKLYLAGRSELYRVDTDLIHSTKLITNDKHLQSPRSPAVFEDYIYVLNDNYKINRCLTFGKKTCEPYIYRLYDIQSFVIRHPSVQRDDLRNECEGFTCDNVCVLGQLGPICVCEDGAISNHGRCPLVQKIELPLFNGRALQDFIRDHHVSVTLITITVLLFVLYLAVFVYYHCVYRPRKAALTLPVRFQNQTSTDETASTAPVIDMPTTSGAFRGGHEFVNPLQFMRDIFQRSFRSQRPIGTAGLSFEIPQPTEDVSDTESDMDYKAEELLIR